MSRRVLQFVLYGMLVSVRDVDALATTRIQQ